MTHKRKERSKGIKFVMNKIRQFLLEENMFIYIKNTNDFFKKLLVF